MSQLRNVAIVGFAQAPIVAADEHHTASEMLYPVVKAALAQCGVERKDIDYQCAGSSDYVDGRAFSFSQAMEVMGAWPPVQDSHVEMDAVFAAHLVWVKMQAEECDSAIVCGFGKCSEGSAAHVLNLQLDPFYHAPIGLDPVSTAALQASATMARMRVDDAALAEIAARNRAAGAKNPDTQLRKPATAAELQATPWAVKPLREGYLPPVGETATCMILAAAGKAEKLCDKPVWIQGVDHRIELQAIGARDLTRSASAKLAAEKAFAMAGLGGAREADVVELGSTNPVEELVLRESLGLPSGLQGNGGGPVVNPSGSALCGNPLMNTGLLRLAEGFRQLSGRAGERAVSGAKRAVVHAAAGHCLQQNIVWVLGTERRWS
ncbi:MAG TPA: lipid-transfer protein [Candidatus Binatia bacterium]|nr:lipid-transfer protein [Candidatus Binatia bacterium]